MNIHALNIRKYISRKKTISTLVVIITGVLAYILFFHTIVLSPLAERTQMKKLEEIKQQHTLSTFVSDGCSGTVSQGWRIAIQELSKLSIEIEDRYKDAQYIPFEDACVAHDRSYHIGEGGYVARLQADNLLRDGILSYGIENTEEIKARVGLGSDEEALFLYEMIAETVYRGVRLGGAPCTGTPYAWGFGYNNGSCN